MIGLDANIDFERSRHKEFEYEMDSSMKLLEKHDNASVHSVKNEIKSEYIERQQEDQSIGIDKSVENQSFCFSTDDSDQTDYTSIKKYIDKDSGTKNDSFVNSEDLVPAKDEVKSKETIEKEPHNTSFRCNFCGKIIRHKKNLKRHKIWRCKKAIKHTNHIVLDEKIIEKAKYDLQESFFVCDFCCKQYTSFEGLNGHKTRCKKIGLIADQKELPGSGKEEPLKECEFLKKYGYCNEKPKMKLKEGCKKSTMIKPSEEAKNQLICYCKQPIQPFGCLICTEKYSTMALMFRHLETVHKWSTKDMKKLMHKCSMCKSSFWKQIELEEHEKMHKRILNCSICGLVFTRKDRLKHHFDYTHGGKEKDFCEICKKEFTGKQNLRNHISEVHEGIKCHFCSKCDYSSFSSGALKYHIASVHESKRPFSCPICGLAYKLRSHLNQHVAAVHDKKKSFRCEICGKGFFDNPHLRKHQDSHANIRPHNCIICDAKFKRKHHLGNHLKTIHGTLDKSLI